MNTTRPTISDEELELIHKSQAFLSELFMKWKGAHAKVLATKRMLDQCFYYKPNDDRIHYDCVYKDFTMHVTPFDRSDSVQYSRIFTSLIDELNERDEIEMQLEVKLNVFRRALYLKKLNPIYRSVGDSLKDDKTEELCLDYEHFEGGVYVLSRILAAFGRFSSTERITEMHKKFREIHDFYSQKSRETRYILSRITIATGDPKQIQDVFEKIRTNASIAKYNLILNDFTSWIRVIMANNTYEIQASDEEENNIDNEIIPATDDDNDDTKDLLYFQSSQPRYESRNDDIMASLYFQSTQPRDNNDFSIGSDGIIPYAQRSPPVPNDDKINRIYTRLGELNLKLIEARSKCDSLHIWVLDKNQELTPVYLKATPEEEAKSNQIIDDINLEIHRQKIYLADLKPTVDFSDNQKRTPQEVRTKRIMQIKQDIKFIENRSKQLDIHMDLLGEMSTRTDDHSHLKTILSFGYKLNIELKMHENDAERERKTERNERSLVIDNESRIQMNNPKETKHSITCPLSGQKIVQFDENGNKIQYVVNHGCGHIFHKDTYDQRIEMREMGYGGQEGMFCWCGAVLNAWPFSQTEQHWPIGWKWQEQEDTNPIKKKKF